MDSYRKPIPYISSFVTASVFRQSSGKPKRQNAYPAFLIKLGALAGGILLLVPLAITLVMQLPMFSKYDMYSSNGGEGANLTIFLQIAVLLLGIALARWAVSVKNGALYMLIIVFAALEIVFATIGFSSTFIKRIGLYFSFLALCSLASRLVYSKTELVKFLRLLLSCFMERPTLSLPTISWVNRTYFHI